MKPRFVLVALACGALLCLLATGCSKKASGGAESQTQSQDVPVTLSPVKDLPVGRTVEIVGTLCGDEETVISAKVAGKVIDIRADLGDRVRPGQILAQVDQTDYTLVLAQKQTALQETLAKLGLSMPPDEKFDPDQVPTVVRARCQAENAQAKLNRGRKLFDQKPPLLSDQEFADLQTAYNVAKSAYDVELLTVQSLLAEVKTHQSDLNAATQKVNDATIRTPVAAATMPAITTQAVATRYAVAARMASVGQYVQEGTPMFRLVADNPIKFRAQVSERFISQTVLGQKVLISVESRPNTFEGTIVRISPQVDTASRTFPIEVIVDNSESLLKAGSFARGSIQIQTDQHVAFVPLDAIVTFAGATKVFAVKDGKAVELPIRTGVRRDNYIEALGDLGGADAVVTVGASKLSQGVPVTVRQTNSTSQPLGQTKQ